MIFAFYLLQLVQRGVRRRSGRKRGKNTSRDKKKNRKEVQKGRSAVERVGLGENEKAEKRKAQ